MSVCALTDDSTPESQAVEIEDHDEPIKDVESMLDTLHVPVKACEDQGCGPGAAVTSWKLLPLCANCMQSGKQPVVITRKRKRKVATGNVHTGKRAKAGGKQRGGEQVSVNEDVPCLDTVTGEAVRGTGGANTSVRVIDDDDFDPDSDRSRTLRA